MACLKNNRYTFVEFEEDYIQIVVSCVRTIYSPSHSLSKRQSDNITHTQQCRILINVKGRTLEEIRSITETFASMSDSQLIERYGDGAFCELDYSKDNEL